MATNEITSGPSVFDLMLALFDPYPKNIIGGKSQRYVYFEYEGPERFGWKPPGWIKAYITKVERLDSDTDQKDAGCKWGIEGRYAFPGWVFDKKFTAVYDAQTRKGSLTLEDEKSDA